MKLDTDEPLANKPDPLGLVQDGVRIMVYRQKLQQKKLDLAIAQGTILRRIRVALSQAAETDIEIVQTELKIKAREYAINEEQLQAKVHQLTEQLKTTKKDSSQTVILSLSHDLVGDKPSLVCS